MRPASPKYDESTFFFTNPFPTVDLTQRRPSSVVRRQLPAAGAAPAAAAQVEQEEQQTPAGQRLPRSRLQLAQAAGPGSSQKQRPSRLGVSTATADLPGSQAGAQAGGTGSTPGSQQEQQQRPPGTLLKSVLKSALKGAAPGRGSQQELQRQVSQGSEGSGSSAKRVSFAGGSGSQEGPLQAQEQQVQEQQVQKQQVQQQPVAQAAAALVGATAAAPTQLTAAETQRRRQGFVSQITPPSPGLGGSAGATPLSQAGFKQRRCVAGKGQQLTLLSLELHAESRWGRAGPGWKTLVAMRSRSLGCACFASRWGVLPVLDVQAASRPPCTPDLQGLPVA